VLGKPRPSPGRGTALPALLLTSSPPVRCERPPPVNDDPYLGLSILRQLREEHEYQKPIVVCSRVKNPVVLQELEALGVAQILRKPVRPSELYQAVTEALAESGPDS
jgi:CheY-like chemotaxis protein